MDVEVVIRVNLSQDGQREITQVVSDQTTVGSFIRKFCKEHGIPMKSNYVLTGPDSTEPLRWSSRLVNCNVNSGTMLVLCENGDDAEETEMRMIYCNLWWPFAFICFMIGLIGITAIVVVKHIQSKPDYEYGIVMDAGSSHTKLFVYKWNGAKEENTAVAEQVHVCPVPGPGISSYQNNTKGLIPGLQHCLNEAESLVPEDKRSTTPVYLGATAGMRLIHEVNSTVTDAILKTVRDTIGGYSFKFDDPANQARIISGAEEGLYSWVTVNYLTGKFGQVHPMSLRANGKWLLDVREDMTFGAMDMGGASTQMTFYPGSGINIPADYSGNTVLYGTNYSVYTHSYLCYGINEIERKFKARLVKSQNFSSTIQNPCAPMDSLMKETYTDVFEAPCTKKDPMFVDYLDDKNTVYNFTGTGNVSQCTDTVDLLFNFSAPCGFSECSFNGTYQAPVHGDFYAFSNFFYELSFLNLTKNTTEVSLKDYTAALTNLCSLPWSKVKDIPAVDPVFLPWYCFRGHYILSLLTKAYHFNETNFRNIRFVNTVNKKTEIGWSLGFMISSSTSVPALTPDIMLTQTAFYLLVVLFVMFVILGIGFLYLGGRYQKFKQRGMYEKLKSYGAV